MSLRTQQTLLKREFEKRLTKGVVQKREEVWFDFLYQAKSWEKPRRTLCRLEWKIDQLFPVCSSIVTNDESCTSKEGFKFYNGRANIEGLIEEGKNGFSWDHLSHKSFEANATEFQLFLLAVQVTQLFRRLAFPERKRSKKLDNKSSNKRSPLLTIQTIRQQLIFVAGRVVRSARKFVFKCASGFPFQALFLKTLENIQALPRFG